MGAYIIKSNIFFHFVLLGSLGPYPDGSCHCGVGATEPQMRNPCHSSLQNSIAAAQLPNTQSLIKHELHRDNLPTLITSSSLAIMKCCWFIPVLRKAKSPCTPRIFSREVEIPWWCLGPSYYAYISFCCRLLQHLPGTIGKVPQSFAFPSAPIVVQHLLEGASGPGGAA